MPDTPETRIRLLEEQAAEARAERKALDRQLATFGPLATQILGAINDLRHLTEDFRDHERSSAEAHRGFEQKIETIAHVVGDLSNAVKNLREDYDEDQEGREQERKTMADARRNFGVAMIGAFAVVVAALIAAIATIVSAGM